MEHIKRNLVKEIVQVNVATVRGGKRRTARHAPRPPTASWLLALGVGLPLCLSALSSLLWPPPRAPLPVSRVTSLVPERGATEAETRKRPEATASSCPQTASPPVRLSAPQPIDRVAFPLAVRNIMLDPGHGGRDVGAVAANGLAEKELTLDITQRLRALLEEAAFKVWMTREKDETVSLAHRASLAEAKDADVFISIHVNWIKMRKVRGAETYYLGPTSNPHAVQLSKVENRESGYSLADFRQLLEEIYADARREESRMLAETIQKALFSSTRVAVPDAQDRGVRTAPFLVLVATDIPAVLVEVAYLSNLEEARLLANEQYRQHLAQALYQGICTYADARSLSTRKVADS